MFDPCDASRMLLNLELPYDTIALAPATRCDAVS